MSTGIFGLTNVALPPATNDVVAFVDVSDPAQSPAGSTRKMTVGILFTTPSISGPATITSTIPPLIVNTTTTGIFGHVKGQRSGVTTYFVGMDASDNFAILNADSTVAVTVATSTNTGTVSFAAPITIAGTTPTVVANCTTTGIFGHIRGQRSGVTKYHLGFDASDNFAVLNADSTVAMKVTTATNASTVTTTAGLVVGGTVTVGSTTLISSSVTLAANTGSNTASFAAATAPVAGSPTKWIGILDNGTLRYIPTWN